MKNKLKGFTLVELVITIAIIVILSMISAPIYNNHKKKTELAEGYAMLAQVREAQIRYYNEYRNFLCSWSTGRGIYDTTNYDPILGVSTMNGKYYKYFQLFWGDTPGNQWYFTAFVSKDTSGAYEGPYKSSGGTGRLYLTYNLTSGSTYRIP